jgi:thiazole/oxazole-forming peptide maturase SagD family component
VIACSTIPARIVFGRALETPDTEDLRRHLARAMDRPELEAVAVAVETFFDLFHGLARIASDAAPRDTPHHFLILDLQRAIVFRDSGVAGEPGLCSLVRFLLDGYPLQPFLRFADAEQDRPWRFSFDPIVLELSARCLAELVPGEYRVLDFLTGAVLSGRLFPHPQATPPRIVDARAPAAGLPLRPLRTDRSLRSAAPPDLSAFVGEAAGIIRREQVGPNHASMPCSITTISLNRGAASDACGARTLRLADARAVARCEALERFQVMKQTPAVALVRGSYRELAEHAVDPLQLFFGRSPECPEDEDAPFDANVTISWAWAWGPFEQRWRLVPAQDSWFNTTTLMKEPRFVRATTNGCAIGATFEEACVAGVLEVIERDSFLTSWYLRRPAVQIAFESFETDVMRDLLGRFRLVLHAYRLVLIDITSDVGIPAVGAFAIREHGDGARIIVAAAADLDAETACARALKDLIGFNPDISAERKAELRKRLGNPASIVGVDGHWELYVLDEVFDAFDYLRLDERRTVAVQDMGADSPAPRDPQLRLDLLLETLDRRLHDVGAAMYLQDLTHPGLAACGLRTARAITPGLYPIWFGALRRRFAVTDRLRRLAEPYTGRPFAREHLQLAPHPMH